jgi:hypothetical protein
LQRPRVPLPRPVWVFEMKRCAITGLMYATPFAPRTSSFLAGEASQATVSGSRRQQRLDERGAVVLAIVLVLIMLRCDEALDREVLRPFKNFVGGALRR